MNILKLTKPITTLNKTIEILDKKVYEYTKALIEINEMTDKEQELLGNKAIIELCEKATEYNSLSNNLKEIREYIEKQILNSKI